MALSESVVLDALRVVQDPDLHRDIVSLGFVKHVNITGGHVAFTVELTTPACPVQDLLRDHRPGIAGADDEHALHRVHFHPGLLALGVVHAAEQPYPAVDEERQHEVDGRDRTRDGPRNLREQREQEQVDDVERETRGEDRDQDHRHFLDARVAPQPVVHAQLVVDQQLDDHRAGRVHVDRIPERLPVQHVLQPQRQRDRRNHQHGHKIEQEVMPVPHSREDG